MSYQILGSPYLLDIKLGHFKCRPFSRQHFTTAWPHLRYLQTGICSFWTSWKGLHSHWQKQLMGVSLILEGKMIAVSISFLRPSSSHISSTSYSEIKIFNKNQSQVSSSVKCFLHPVTLNWQSHFINLNFPSLLIKFSRYS